MHKHGRGLNRVPARTCIVAYRDNSVTQDISSPLPDLTNGSKIETLLTNQYRVGVNKKRVYQCVASTINSNMLWYFVTQK